MSFDILQYLNIKHGDYYEFCEKNGLKCSLDKNISRLREEAELFKKQRAQELFKDKNKKKKMSFEEQFYDYIKQHSSSHRYQHNNLTISITEIKNKPKFNFYLNLFSKFSPKDVVTIFYFLNNLANDFIEPHKSLDNFKPKSKNIEKVALDILNNYIFKYPVIKSLSHCFFQKNNHSDLQNTLILAVYQLSQGVKFKNIKFFGNIHLTRKQLHFALSQNSKFHGLEHLRFAQIQDYQPKIIQAVMKNNNKTSNFSLNENLFQEFLIYMNNQELDMFETDQIMPLFDYICQQDRQARNDGTTFTIKHHSLFSLYTKMIEWHRKLNSKRASLEWEPSPLFQPLEIIKEKTINNSVVPVVYKIVELTTEKELIAEGKQLHHCVASYANRCFQGHCRIFSLRHSYFDEKYKSLATIEVVNNRPVQIRGFANKSVIGEESKIINDYFY